MMIYLIFILSALHEQTNWMGGVGVPGPVTNWGNQYWEGDSVTTATPGQVSLIATETNHDNWEKHIIESNPGIPMETQGLMPVDIDKDGAIDFVAHTNDSVVWYKNEGNWNYSKQMVGPAPANGTNTPCVWPEDINNDGLMDILVATDGFGAGWYENPGWSYHNLDDSIGYHRICACDVDLNDTIDIIAVANTCTPFEQYCGNIYLFRNTGTGFNKELIKDFSGKIEGWRVYPADFNGDGYPDIYSVFFHTYIFLNDGTGHFDSVYFHQWSAGAPDFDGAWAQDIDMDGDVDLVTANVWNGGYPYGFWVHRNDDGYNYSLEPVSISAFNDYSDGAMASDIDLDGLPDIAGTYKKVGWYRQKSDSSFEEHFIGAVNNSHWIYAEDVDGGCVPDIDLIVTDEGAHIVYENRMLSRFALRGNLVSSVLELHTEGREVRWFGWEACVPRDSTVAFYWRGDSALPIDTLWNGPYYAEQNIDSIAIPSWPCYRYFQYKVEFFPDTSALDIAVLDRVWVKDTICGAQIEEKEDASRQGGMSLKIWNDKILLFPSKPVKNIELCIYNVAGEVVQAVYKGSVESGKYEFAPVLGAKGVYVVVLKWPGGVKAAKLIKIK